MKSNEKLLKQNLCKILKQCLKYERILAVFSILLHIFFYLETVQFQLFPKYSVAIIGPEDNKFSPFLDASSRAGTA